jgi:Flp pilus assembly protein TadD
MIRLSALALAILLGLSGPAVAMGSGSGGDTGAARTPAKPADPNYAAGKSAIDAGNWQGAIDALTRAVAADASNPDAFNYLGYANRKLGKFPDAFTHYQKALALNPEHKGAHEYIGEAYLETGNLAKAEEHLKALDKICLFSCKEYTELKARVAEFKSKKAS